MTILGYDEFDSPVGTIVVFTAENAICHLDFSDCQDRIDVMLERRFGQYQKIRQNNPLLIRQHMYRYFKGDRNAFETIPINTGGTQFQQKVWQALLRIPFGKTWSYAELATRIQQKSAIRAVAGANAKNPIAIIIPCHRVIASNGALSGYAGGVHRKQWFLSHEADTSGGQANPVSDNCTGCVPIS